jgi:poly-gamma-glutamate capsule biosynthesis protein CapA/YwtB (metallophosphatase superfamily)
LRNIIQIISIVVLWMAIGVCAEEPAVATFWIGGDVNLGAGGEKIFQPLAPALEKHPGFVNLEGPVILGDESRTRLKVFNASEGLDALRALGVQVVSIANNHARDAGEGAPTRTIAALQEANIVPAGLAAGAATLEISGKKIVFTSHDLSHGLPKNLRRELAAASASGDFLVATFHVSGPPAGHPTALLRQAAAIALAAGARVIAAHGSHRIGPVERRGGAVIAWGLGNLAFACDCTRERAGMILEITVEDKNQLRAAVIPIRAGIRGGAVEPEPRPEKIFARLKKTGSSSIRRDGVRGWF